VRRYTSATSSLLLLAYFYLFYIFTLRFLLSISEASYPLTFNLPFGLTLAPDNGRPNVRPQPSTNFLVTDILVAMTEVLRPSRLGLQPLYLSPRQQ
jgi:hypothetical protein